MKIIAVLSLFLIILSASTCDNQSSNLLPGTYTGKFIVIYADGQRQNHPVSVTFTQSNYQSTSGANRIPAGGAGTFTVVGNKIIFQDENMWTADFDWELTLNGEYHYQLKGNSLKITREYKDQEKKSITYELVKSN